MDAVNYMDEYRTGADYVTFVPKMYREDKVIEIQIAKLGGGSVGKAYDGKWIANLIYDDELIFSSADLDTPIPHTHEHVSVLFLDFVIHSEEPYNDAVADFREREYDRVNLWVTDNDE